MNEERTTDMGLYNFAKDYIVAARLLMDSGDYERLSRFRAPLYFLYSHGIELLLKAYLRNKGATLEKLKSCGHSLDKCYKACLALELPKLSEELEEILEILDQYHSSFENRYIVTGIKTRPANEQDIYKLADALNGSIGPKIHAAWQITKPAELTN